MAAADRVDGGGLKVTGLSLSEITAEDYKSLQHLELGWSLAELRAFGNQSRALGYKVVDQDGISGVLLLVLQPAYMMIQIVTLCSFGKSGILLMRRIKGLLLTSAIILRDISIDIAGEHQVSQLDDYLSEGFIPTLITVELGLDKCLPRETVSLRYTSRTRLEVGGSLVEGASDDECEFSYIS